MSEFATSAFFEIQGDYSPAFHMEVKRMGQWVPYRKGFTLVQAEAAVERNPGLFRIQHRTHIPEAGILDKSEMLLVKALRTGTMTLQGCLFVLKVTPTGAIWVVGGGFNLKMSREIACMAIARGYFTKEQR